MVTFRVEWSTEVEADSPLAAALAAVREIYQGVPTRYIVEAQESEFGPNGMAEREGRVVIDFAEDLGW